ncbi:hypothetical protein C1H46_039710 [Malus baccata]|uniref:AAA+ ATPase At3g28540-like C-terminal domain-containing protein n=1 Tax=Malus baccata TaxID=106549 RepID=A0A540KKN0_MALBA|nr:hypothetical protein C1H46_039710 [Malus baccata]
MTSVSGLTGSPSRFCFQIPARSSGSLRGRVSNFPRGWKPAGKNELLRVERSYWTGFAQRLNARKTHLIKFAVDASYGDMSNEPTAIFPRINVRDPYKRLGISREASEDEIQGARNFLIRQYAGHKPSVDAIESAHDKIIMQKFYDRKNPKIDFKKKYREVNQSRVVQAVRNRFRTPSTIFIVKTSIAFLVLAALTVLFPTEEGPTLQVALSLLATIYFVHDRLKSKLRAFLYSAGSFAFSWLFGTFLMVSVVPPLLKGPRSFETVCGRAVAMRGPSSPGIVAVEYCTPTGFSILASNYLGVRGRNDHRLCGEVEGLIEDKEVSPAEVAEELMKRDDADVALHGLVNFLERKKVENDKKRGGRG